MSSPMSFSVSVISHPLIHWGILRTRDRARVTVWYGMVWCGSENQKAVEEKGSDGKSPIRELNRIE